MEDLIIFFVAKAYMHISIVKSQQWRGANRITQVTPIYLRDYFWGNFFWNFFTKIFKNLEFLKYYYVKVYVKDFKKYFNFKIFETHLEVIFMLKSNHYNV
jgi:hypothetical protein